MSPLSACACSLMDKTECAVSMLKSIVSVPLLPRAAHRGFHKVSMTEPGRRNWEISFTSAH